MGSGWTWDQGTGAPRLYGEGVSEDRRPEEGSGNGRERAVLDRLPPVSFSVYRGGKGFI